MKETLYLLDTSVLLHLIRNNELGRFIRHTFSLNNASVHCIISIVTHGEILTIADRYNWRDEKRETLREMLDNFVTIDLNAQEILAAYVEIDRLNRTADRGSRHMSHNDQWIAATAKASNASLLTSDQDFLHLHPQYLFVEYVDPDSKLASGS